jgi:putative ABC transport system permease protein
MIKNYFTIAFRAFAKQKSHAIINITGLAVGLASAMMIFLYIHSELTFDDVFPYKYETYRLGFRFTDAQGNVQYNTGMAGGWGKRLKEDLPEVIEDFKDTWYGMPTSIQPKGEDKILLTEEVLWVEGDIYKMIYFPLIKGNREKALAEPNTLVLSESAAKELFGDEDPLNQQVIIKHNWATNGKELLVTVTGVVRDYPDNTHFNPKYMINYRSLKPFFNFQPGFTFEQFEDDMLNGFFNMYILTKNADPKKIEKRMEALIEEVLKSNPQVRQQIGNTKIEPIVRSVADIHFDKDIPWVNEGAGNKLYIYIFGSIALLIVVIASINYMNLSTARSGKRSKEVGLRKSLGSERGQLVQQFMLESLVLVSLGFIGAILLVVVLLPLFSQMAERNIPFISLLNPQLILAFFCLLLLVSFLSGMYPALFLSGFNTIEVLKGKFSFSRGSNVFRKVLTGFQFAIAVFLLILTIVFVRQMDLMKDSRLNAKGEQILSIRHGGVADYGKYQAFRNLILQDPDLSMVACGNHLPRLDYFGPLQTPYKFPDLKQDEFNWNTFHVDYDFPGTFDLELIAGRFFEQGNVSDSTSIILNETACKALGKSPAEILGTTMTSPHVNGYFDYNYNRLRTGRIIGVVKDFPYKSAYQVIEPLVIDPTPHQVDRIIYVKLPQGKYQEKIAFIEKQWKQVYPGLGLDYWFVNDEFNRMYKAERRIASLSRNFSGLAILITCVGLFGLASFVAEQRTKEIGIRKAMGATNTQILWMLLLTFLKVLLWSTLVAVPLAYFVSDKLLQNFVYRIPLDALTGIVAVIIIVILTVITVSYESVKASIVNPVKSLRYE